MAGEYEQGQFDVPGGYGDGGPPLSAGGITSEVIWMQLPEWYDRWQMSDDYEPFGLTLRENPFLRQEV